MTLPDSPEAIVELTARDLDDIVESAAKRGARMALEEIGLNDQSAVDDVKELRGLIKVWREARTTALQTAVKTITIALLGLIAAGAYLKLGVAPPK